MKKIHSSSAMLQRILNDILDFSKMEAGELTIENVEFSMDKIIEEMEALYEAKAGSKSLEFKVVRLSKLPNRLKGDPFRLEQVFGNLINNAIKFTQHGFVRVEVGWGPNEETKLGRLVVSVRDSGIGISNQKINQLFTPFKQVDASTSRKSGGTGLGLSICHHLITQMGGHIAVESSINGGIVFKFEVPLQKAAVLTQRTVELQQKRSSLVGFKIRKQFNGEQVLLVEDSPINQLVTKGFLEVAGLAVETASNGLEAIEMVKEKDFNLILMDIQMPEMDGYSTTDWHRKTQKAKQLPIIAMTAYALDSEKQKCLDSGMNDFISKPIEAQSFYKTLEKWIASPEPSLIQ